MQDQTPTTNNSKTRKIEIEELSSAEKTTTKKTVKKTALSPDTNYSFEHAKLPSPQPVEKDVAIPAASFKLHIAEAKAPNHNISAAEKLNQQRKKNLTKKADVTYVKKAKNKLWNTLEWLSTSAMIFMILFFAINYSSYAALFGSKLDQLRGIASRNPAIAELLSDNKNITQQLLPLTSTVAQSKKNIPPINIQIAPADDRIIIPDINKSVPIVRVSTENLIKRDWSSLEKDIQGALQDGVVHYPGTAQPGDHGNVVITGHSSYFAWDPGNFKDVFALLHQVNVGDKIIVYHDQKKYNYEVYEKKVIAPEQVEVLTQKGDDRLTLITCTPVGTNLRRLIVLARPTT